MKTMVLATWKWLLLGLILAIVGAFFVFGLGKRRGSRSYRWRMALWTVALTLMSGGFMAAPGCDGGDEKKADTQVGQDTSGGGGGEVRVEGDVANQPDERIMCYIPREPDMERQPDATVGEDGGGLPPDTVISCYAPRPPDWTEEPDVSTEPDVPIMCYDPVLEDIKSDVPPRTPDAGIEQDTVEEPDQPGPMCYAPPMPGDH